MNWTDDLGEAHKRQEEEKKRKADGMMWASIKTPVMTSRLISRLKSDAESAATKVNTKIIIHLDADKLQINHDSYPTFFLQIKVPIRGLTYSNPVIECLVATKKNSSSEQKQAAIEIPVSCVGPDECYYHIGENERATEEQVSESLLKPLFAGII